MRCDAMRCDAMRCDAILKVLDGVVGRLQCAGEAAAAAVLQVLDTAKELLDGLEGSSAFGESAARYFEARLALTPVHLRPQLLATASGCCEQAWLPSGRPPARLVAHFEAVATELRCEVASLWAARKHAEAAALVTACLAAVRPTA
jgi:hypothetical protein